MMLSKSKSEGISGPKIFRMIGGSLRYPKSIFGIFIFLTVFFEIGGSFGELNWTNWSIRNLADFMAM